jgi:glycosyltransferase involved in cell wall biosynthesis
MNNSLNATRSLRIAYVLCENVDQETGILKKLVLQMSYWKKKGHEVKLFVAAQSIDCWIGLEGLDVDITLIQKFSNKMDINLLYTKIHPWAPDILYLRFSWFYPFMYKICSKYPAIMEINSDDTYEVKENLMKDKKYLIYVYYKFTRNYYYRLMTGFVFLSNEMKDTFSRFKQPNVVIANGIDLSKYPVRKTPNNCRPKIVFIGSAEQKWHGVDKIAYMATQFPNCDFDIIGLNPIDKGEYTSSNINFHGHLDQLKYSEILEMADVAIGSLAIHRTFDTEASPLKVREYLAYGIPTIIAYKETDFPNGAPFLLNLPNTENNVKDNLIAIEKYIYTWKGKRVQRHEIQQIDIAAKEERRILFFYEVLNKQ